MQSANIFGVRVDKVVMEEAVALAIKWVQGKGKHYIVTPNIEFVMAAQKDPEFKRILNESDLSIPDGAGLKLRSDIESIIAGVDLLEELCKVASKRGFTVGFLGGRAGVAKECAECLVRKYPGLDVSFAEDGPEVDKEGNVLSSKYYGKKTKKEPLIRNTIPISRCNILFVAFGQVKQEKWIAKNLPNIPVKVAMGVGGSFDEIAGRVPRIPSWVHQIGLKWLIRLLLQPWRIKRQLALIKFVWMCLIHNSKCKMQKYN